MKAIFLQNIKGSVDGTKSIEYKKDQIYLVNGIQLSKYLFDAWSKQGIVKEFKEEPKIEEKSFEKAPENKAFEKAPEKKKLKLKNK